MLLSPGRQNGSDILLIFKRLSAWLHFFNGNIIHHVCRIILLLLKLKVEFCAIDFKAT